MVLIMLVTGKHDDGDVGDDGGGNGGGDNRDCKIQRRGRQQERQINYSFYRQNNNFALAPRFLYISLPVFARLRRENA